MKSIPAILLAACLVPAVTSAQEEGSPSITELVRKDPVTARTFSILAPGMGHFYNGNVKKMKKYQQLHSLAILPILGGLAMDIHKDSLSGVDHFRDLGFKKFPWWTFGGLVVTGILREMIRDADSDEAFRDAARTY